MEHMLSNVDVCQVIVWLDVVGLVAVVLIVYFFVKTGLKKSVEEANALELLVREQLAAKRARTIVFDKERWGSVAVKPYLSPSEDRVFSADKYCSEHHTDLDIDDSHELVQCHVVREVNNGICVHGKYWATCIDCNSTVAIDAAWEANHSEKGDLYDEAQ